MKICVFSGTSEGRELSEFLSENRIETLVSVATEYGKEVMDEMPFVTVRTGRLDEKEMERIIRDYDICVDATHPYAVNVTGNIRRAAAAAGVKYLRLMREDTSSGEEKYYRVFDSVREAAGFLKDCDGNIFISTGSKELSEYSVIPGYRERLTVRVLPVKESRDKLRDLGIRNCIFRRGPFSYEDNIRDLKSCNASYLVTKSSGNAGGFKEKADAAVSLGVRIILIRRPDETDIDKTYSMEEVKEEILEIINDNR